MTDFITIIDKEGNQRRVPKDGTCILDTLQDGERIRVSLADAEASRRQLSDIERFVLEDKKVREETAGSRPGFRTMPNDPEFQDGVVARDAVYALYEQELVNSYKHVRDDNWAANTATLSKLPEEDSACRTADGERGVFKRVNGRMVCVPSSRSNSEPEKALSDAMQDREAAYREYADFIGSEWARGK